MTDREQKLFDMLDTMTRYSSALENECERLGNTAVSSPHNVTVAKAEKLLSEFGDGA